MNPRQAVPCEHVEGPTAKLFRARGGGITQRGCKLPRRNEVRAMPGRNPPGLGAGTPQRSRRIDRHEVPADRARSRPGTARPNKGARTVFQAVFATLAKVLGLFPRLAAARPGPSGKGSYTLRYRRRPVTAVGGSHLGDQCLLHALQCCAARLPVTEIGKEFRCPAVVLGCAEALAPTRTAVAAAHVGPGL